MPSDRMDVFRREALPHLRELLRVATRLAGERARGEDLVQETFLQAWRSFDAYRPGTNCRAWLYRILLLLAKARKRKDAAGRAVPLDDVPESVFAISPITPEVYGRDHVLAAFEALGEGQRLVIQLADLEGMSYREVAEVIGVPIGTVMSRLSRARALLRQQLSSRLAARVVGS